MAFYEKLEYVTIGWIGGMLGSMIGNLLSY